MDAKCKERISISALTVTCLLALVSPGWGQNSAAPAVDQRTLELVDQLKDLIQQADRDPRSDRRMVSRLRELVRRYDWPWRVSLFYDDFRDGNYTYDPAWTVSQGDFRVVKGYGLRTAFEPLRRERRIQAGRRMDAAVDLFQGIFGVMRDRDEELDRSTDTPIAAEIFSPVRVSNSFAARLRLKFEAPIEGDGRLEFGPYLGDDRSYGYRLVYESGPRPSLSLLRVAPGRSAVIETADLGYGLDDGRLHVLEWRRGADNEMAVFLDNREVVRTVDRAYTEPFDGVVLVNRAGSYELREIAVFGTEW
ncbi:MAG TPA: hypothetical protein VNN77_08055 [candidate division Zixibacteria bacterium]|nr:hypothetical protein [candidate division Zixibacteria bacterium]